MHRALPVLAGRLGAAAYRQGVLKCVFTGVPLAEVDGLTERADAELARMPADYAEERTAAGRPVPPDVPPLITAARTSPQHGTR